MSKIQLQLQQALDDFKKEQAKYIEKREIYRVNYARAYLESTEKTGDGRKCAADIATSSERIARDFAETFARVKWQEVLALRGKVEDSRMPGEGFDND